jgi:hypothetical protein
MWHSVCSLGTNKSLSNHTCQDTYPQEKDSTILYDLFVTFVARTF